MRSILPPLATRLLLAGSLLAVQALPVRASDGVSTAKGHHSEVRLMAGGPVGDGIHRAAVAIRLDKGWKTYWRNPGDSGIPPRFDWSASRNVAEASVDWPAPDRFSDAGGITYGYANGVTFPVRVRAADPAKPVTLVLALEFGVCKDICIPGQADLQTVSDRPRPAILALVEEADRSVPVSRPLGAKSAPAILGLAPLDAGGGRFEVSARLAPGETARLFVEGPDGWFFDVPDPVTAGADGRATLSVQLLQRPTAPAPKPELTLTLVGPSSAVETRAALDAGASPR